MAWSSAWLQSSVHRLLGAGQSGGQALQHIARFARVAGPYRDDIVNFNRAMIRILAFIIGDHRAVTLV